MKPLESAMDGDEGTELRPKLRFPGFDAEWTNDPLSSVLVEHKEKNHDGCEVFSVSLEHGIINQIAYLGRSFAASDTSNYNRARPFDIAYTKSPLRDYPFGIVKQCRTDRSVALSPLYGVFTPANRNLGLLIEAYFDSPSRSKLFLAPLCQKGAKNTIQISNATFLSGRLPLPRDTDEQQKIADCLSSLDELITAESQKLEALKAHKKGLMQQLFTREGETTPRLRFPEFRNSSSWEEARLEDMAKRGSGHTPSKSKPEYYNGGIKWVSLADSKRLDAGLISTTETEISEQGIENSSAVLHPAGSVLVSRDAGVGKCAVMDTPMAVSQHFIVWACDSKRLLNWFLYYVLQTMKPLFERTATGSTIKTIGLQFFIDLRIKIPSVVEQERIASCLNSISELIVSEEQKLEALRKQKWGLMQQLFPTTSEAKV